MSSMLYSESNIEIWNFHIIAFCFYSQYVQCPNFFGIGFVLYLFVFGFVLTYLYYVKVYPE